MVTAEFVAVQGQGTVNNSGAYDSLILATTGSVTKIRVRLTKRGSGEVVFDTQPGDPDAAPPTTKVTSGQIRIAR